MDFYQEFATIVNSQPPTPDDCQVGFCPTERPAIAAVTMKCVKCAFKVVSHSCQHCYRFLFEADAIGGLKHPHENCDEARVQVTSFVYLTDMFNQV